jgi:hypothetical protein
VVGGYAVAAHDEPEPVTVGAPVPVAAHDPDVPTPPVATVEPDPTYPALQTNVPLEPTTLRTSKRNGYALRVDLPQGWLQHQQPGNTTWTFTPTPLLNTYLLRVGILANLHESVAVAKKGRITALRDAQTKGDLEDLSITAQDGDSLLATYVDSGHLRVTNERWFSLGGSAYAVAAVTGRTIDSAGIGDLLDAVAASMQAG